MTVEDKEKARRNARSMPLATLMRLDGLGWVGRRVPHDKVRLGLGGAELAAKARRCRR